jgi:hypothetical protein
VRQLHGHPQGRLRFLQRVRLDGSVRLKREDEAPIP